MAEYNKAQVQELGVAIVDMVEAVADGLDIADVTVGMSLLRKFVDASDDLALNKEAALLDIAAGIASIAADRQREVPDAE